MNSHKWEYRIVTTHDGKYGTEMKILNSTHSEWTTMWFCKYETAEDARNELVKQIERDNFVPTVVEI